jgi:transcriptional regulator with XRE-family HTH domain
MPNTAKKLGDNIRRIRLERGLTQVELSKKLKADRSYMSNVEQGKKNPTLTTMEKIANVLGVSTEELLK